MNNYAMEYDYRDSAAQAIPAERASFIRKTYGHLAAAILAFVALEAVMLKVLPVELIFARFSSSGIALVCLLLFIGVSWGADYVAHRTLSRGVQYLCLSLYVAVEVVFFMPILYFAEHRYPGAITQAAILTLAVFAGLTIAVLVTRKDFSFLRSALIIGSIAMLGVGLAGFFIGFNMGLFFCFAGVALATGFILYDTSNVLHHYNTQQYVAASLALFASVAMLFYYILRIVMESRR